MMRKALFIVVAATLLGVVAGCSGGNAANTGSAPSSSTTITGGGATVEPSEDAFARVGGWIAFRSGSEIVAVDPANPKDTLVLGPSLGDDPIAWSSDGTKLLLRSRLEESGVPWPGLFVLSRDGSRTTLLPEAVEPTRPPPTWGSFSPDGTEVAYASDGSSRGPYIIDADGGKPRPLGDRCKRTKVGGKRVELCGEPLSEAAAWSPDGSRIAWVDFVEDSAKYGHHAGVLSFVNPDGTDLREEVAPLPGEGAPSLVWSPDGSRLAFWGPSQIFVINADGSGLQQITDEGVNRWPTWSPDGSRIAFVHDGTLYTMAPDGTDMQRVKGVMPDGAIAWNPVA
jgi:Tol biopolymer transport system component